MCEQCEALANAINHGQMRIAEQKAHIVDMLGRLDRDDLQTMATMIDYASNDPKLAGLYVGLIKGFVINRFDTDFDGQTMQESMAAEDMVSKAEKSRDQAEQLPLFDVGIGIPSTRNPETGERIPLTGDEVAQIGEQPGINPQFFREDGYPIEEIDGALLVGSLKQFNLEMSPTPGRYLCIGCGLEYVSIEDRALRDDCHGCKARAAQG